MFKIFYLIIFVAFCLLSSCKNKKNDITNTVMEWIGKEVKFDSEHVFTYQGEDTVTFEIPSDKYKILVYTDSSGCMSCNLKLRQWDNLIKQIDSEFNNKVSFLFFMHPKNISEMKFILKTHNFTHPICIDDKNKINLLNNFPTNIDMQTFLLNENNKVLAMGNPIHNPKIKELYLSILTGKDNLCNKNIPKTIVRLSMKNIDYGSFAWDKEQIERIVIENLGNSPLVINEVITSCECVQVRFDKKPVLPKKNVVLDVHYKAGNPEYFSKSINIYCNVENSPLKLKITGNAK